MREERIYGSTVWSYNWPEGDPRHLKVGREIPCECYLDAMARKKVGDTTCAWAGAPGTGRIVHCITRMDETGVYGVVIENTIRELEPQETE